jgi:hypothetical protein
MAHLLACLASSIAALWWTVWLSQAAQAMLQGSHRGADHYNNLKQQQRSSSNSPG